MTATRRPRTSALPGEDAFVLAALRRAPTEFVARIPRRRAVDRGAVPARGTSPASSDRRRSVPWRTGAGLRRRCSAHEAASLGQPAPGSRSPPCVEDRRAPVWRRVVSARRPGRRSAAAAREGEPRRGPSARRRSSRPCDATCSQAYTSSRVRTLPAGMPASVELAQQRRRRRRRRTRLDDLDDRRGARTRSAFVARPAGRSRCRTPRRTAATDLSLPTRSARRRRRRGTARTGRSTGGGCPGPGRPRRRPSSGCPERRAPRRCCGQQRGTHDLPRPVAARSRAPANTP